MLPMRSILTAGVGATVGLGLAAGAITVALVTSSPSLADPPFTPPGPPSFDRPGPPPWAEAASSRVQSVPLPSTELLFGVGFIALAWAVSRRKMRIHE